MKRVNNRGFLLAESLVVSTFVLTILMFLFIQFRNLIINYNNSYAYNSVESVYDLGSIGEYFRKNQDKPFGNYIKGNPYLMVYNNGSCNDSIGLKNTGFCDNIMSQTGVETLIYTSSDLSVIQDYVKTTEDAVLKQDLRDFISKVDAQIIQNKGRLFAKFKNGTFATIAIDTKYDDSLETKEYTYTGDVQTYYTKMPGYYKIELWGAQGGSSDNSGGLGSYTKGEVYLDRGQNLYVYVGASGTRENLFNGGGTGWSSSKSGGGGATDVRLTGGAWNDATSLKSRIMVAAGGGGVSNNSNGAHGGEAGTLIGNNGKVYADVVAKTYAGLKAYQTKGGKANSTGGTAGSFGKGGNGAAYSDGHVGGGGGSGYYGGSGAKWHAGGGGGSSYISGYAGVNAINISGVHTNQTIHFSNKYFINTDMQGSVNSQDGMAKISYLGSSPTSDSAKIKNVRYVKNCISGNSVNGNNHWIEIQAISDGVNVAKGKNVTGDFATSSVHGTGTFSTVVDGIIDDEDKYVDGISDNYVNQCVTVDLGQEYNLEEIGVWHYYADGRKYYQNNTYVAGNNNSFSLVDSTSNFKEVSEGRHIKQDESQIAMSDYYVSSAGSDLDGDGTMSHPFYSIKKAYDSAKNGATIHLMSDIGITEKLILTDNKKITLTSYNGTYSLIRNSSFVNESMVDFENGTLTLKNIVLDGNSVQSTGSLIYTNGILNIDDNVTLKNGYSSEKIRSGGITIEGGQTSISGNSINISANTNSQNTLYNNIIVISGTLYDSSKKFTTTTNTYSIASALNNNLKIDVYGAAAANGTNVQMFTSNTSSAQKWKVMANRIENSNIIYNFQSQVDGSQYLWVAGNSSTSKTNIVTWSFHYYHGGHYYISSVGNDYYEFKNIDGLCVDASGNSSGANVWGYTCNKSNAQKWKFIRS